MKASVTSSHLCWLVFALILWPLHPALGQSPAPVKFASGKNGMVATGSTFATEAAVQILAEDGNAADAAAAACLALMVTDPANASLGGRAQILLSLRNGRVIAIDGATQAPAGVKSLVANNENRSGYGVAPVPGAIAAIAQMVHKYGRLSLAQVMQPAIKLAENGFLVPPRLAQSWERTRNELSKNHGAFQLFLKPDGQAYQAGEIFRQPQLAATLRKVAQSGITAFYQGAIADSIVKDMSQNGGFITKSDLVNYRALTGLLVTANYRGHRVVSAGGRAWGNTLTEMLNILSHFKISRAAPNAEEVEVLARVIAQSLDDRPQQIGSLKPKPDGYSLQLISSPKFAAQRAAMIRQQMRDADKRATITSHQISLLSTGQHDTTHLSVMDAEGNAVALTTSIGPSFGSRVASAELGFLYAHSYRMRSDPTPNARDLTEMTPTIVFRQRHPVLAIGGAGSERIPSAILQVISNVIDRGWTLERAMTAPRISALGNRVRLQPGFAEALLAMLRRRGFVTETIEPDAARHAGLVHAVQYNPAQRMYYGAADGGDSGSAASRK